MDAWSEILDQAVGTKVPYNVPRAEDLTYVPRVALSLWCQMRDLYLLPTAELVADLQAVIGGRSALEICAGNSPLGHALGIAQVDSRPPPGSSVARYDALQAVQALRPQVVVAAWSDQLGGVEVPGSGPQGVDECALVEQVECYILIGNRHAHALKKVLGRKHSERQAPYLVSRSTHTDEDVIWTWGH